ncbi:hypothetical protein BDN72DRAFT_773705, partial [Pluteus cervinus]
VRNVYLRCGHADNMVRIVVQCDDPQCIFSTSHPPTCGGPSCRQTCWQYRQYPEQYSPNIDRYCPICSAALAASTNGSA